MDQQWFTETTTHWDNEINTVQHSSGKYRGLRHKNSLPEAVFKKIEKYIRIAQDPCLQAAI